MAPSFPENFRIRENSFIARIAAWKLGCKRVAMVLGNTIHLHQVSAVEFLKDEAWLRHELTHVRQFRQYGFLPFLARYLWESMRHGYAGNRYEIEAKQAERNVEWVIGYSE